jgi:hypothetical protein
MGEPEVIHHYFVDEAGDTTLFSKRGRVLVGTEGCSSVFMLGLAHIPDPDGATQKLNQLRMELLSDPYFKNVPSMKPEEKRRRLLFTQRMISPR